MLLDYKTIINSYFGLGMSGAEIARRLGASKSGVNGFIAAFKKVMHSIIHYRLESLITVLQKPCMDMFLVVKEEMRK